MEGFFQNHFINNDFMTDEKDDIMINEKDDLIEQSKRLSFREKIEQQYIINVFCMKSERKKEMREQRTKKQRAQWRPGYNQLLENLDDLSDKELKAELDHYLPGRQLSKSYSKPKTELDNQSFLKVADQPDENLLDAGLLDDDQLDGQLYGTTDQPAYELYY